MNIFSEKAYRLIIRGKLEQAEKGGRGQLVKISAHIGVQPPVLSQIFSGQKDITIDQAYGICDYFMFSELETDYFIALVIKERAGTPIAKKRAEDKIKKILEQAKHIKERIQFSEIDEKARSRFYSMWYYMGIQLACDLPQIEFPSDLAELFQISPKKISEALEFLISLGLVKKTGGKLSLGVGATHVSSEDPLVTRHHQNWRVLGFEKMDLENSDNLFFTCPATISSGDFKKMRERLLAIIKEFTDLVDPSKPEKLICFNFDFFEVTQNS